MKIKKSSIKKLEEIKFFTDSITKDKELIKAIWLINARDAIKKENELNLIILIDDVKNKNIDEKKIKAKILNAENESEKKFGFKIHSGIYKLREYFDLLMSNNLDIFAEINDSVSIYDPSGFFSLIKKLVEDGQILGTQESIFKFLVEVKRGMRKLNDIKLTILGSIYDAVMDAAEAPLIMENCFSFIPREIPGMLENVFVRKKKLSKKYVSYYTEIMDYYKDYEHDNIKNLDAERIDDLYEKAKDFVKRMEELCKDIKG